MAIPDCFGCKKFSRTEVCPHRAECINGSKEFFEKKDPPKTNKAVIQSMDRDDLAQLIYSFQPKELKDDKLNLLDNIKSWLDQPASNEKVLNCWFLT